MTSALQLEELGAHERDLEDDLEDNFEVHFDETEDLEEAQADEIEPAWEKISKLSKDSLMEWVRIPTEWIQKGRLKEFKWGNGEGSKNESSLITLLVMLHHIDVTNGFVRITYDKLSEKTNLSRTIISESIDILSKKDLITKNPHGRSTYLINNFDPKNGWAKLPARKMYYKNYVKGFGEFSKRKKIELDAIKLYFLFVAGRNNSSNICWISYDKIEEKSGVMKCNIKSAISLLCSLSLITVEQAYSEDSKHIKQGYRIVGINNFKHMGTRGRMSI